MAPAAAPDCIHPAPQQQRKGLEEVLFPSPPRCNSAGSVDPAAAAALDMDMKGLDELMINVQHAKYCEQHGLEYKPWHIRKEQRRGRNCAVIAAIVIVAAVAMAFWYDWATSRTGEPSEGADVTKEQGPLRTVVLLSAVDATLGEENILNYGFSIVPDPAGGLPFIGELTKGGLAEASGKIFLYDRVVKVSERTKKINVNPEDSPKTELDAEHTEILDPASWKTKLEIELTIKRGDGQLSSWWTFVSAYWAGDFWRDSLSALGSVLAGSTFALAMLALIGCLGLFAVAVIHQPLLRLAKRVANFAWKQASHVHASGVSLGARLRRVTTRAAAAKAEAIAQELLQDEASKAAARAAKEKPAKAAAAAVRARAEKSAESREGLSATSATSARERADPRHGCVRRASTSTQAGETSVRARAEVSAAASMTAADRQRSKDVELMWPIAEAAAAAARAAAEAAAAERAAARAAAAEATGALESSPSARQSHQSGRTQRDSRTLHAGRGGRGGGGGRAFGGTLSSSLQEDEDEKEATTCIVCMDAPRTHIFVPCGHHCACEGCGNAIMERAKTCPLCRDAVVMLMPVFTS